jgi:hypothetical protein
MFFIVFGAGASYDSVPEFEWSSEQGGASAEYRPPLANELFAAVGRPRVQGACASRVPGIAGLLGRLQHVARAGANIEEELERLAREAEGGRQDLVRQLVALRFYIKFVVSESTTRWWGLANGVTNFGALAHRLEDLRGGEPILIVTFNYDRMLEMALDPTEVRFREIDDGLRGPDYFLVKLHGSINWSREVTLEGWDQSDVQLMARGDEMQLGVVKHQRDIPGGQPSIPAIAVPTRTKVEFECPTSNVEKLRELLAQVRAGLTIGWGGQEETFLGLLREHLPRRVRVPITVVSKDAGGAKRAASHLRDRLNDVTMVPSTAGGFSDFLNVPERLDAAWRGEAP